MKRVAATVLAFGLLSGAIAWAVLADARETRVQALLARIDAAETGVRYAGIRTVEAGEASFPVRLRSEGDGRISVERTPSRTGGFRGPFSLLRPGFAQGQRRIKDAALAARNYDLVAAGHDVVAGRAADVWEARPKHPGRPTVRVAADRATSLALRVEVFAGPERLFRTEFKEIDFEPSAPFPAEPAPRRMPSWVKVQHREAPASELRGLLDFPLLEPRRLPAGFELRGSGVLDFGVERNVPFVRQDLSGKVAHLDYTDGLAVMSIVQVSATSGLYAMVKPFLRAPAGSEGLTAHRFAGKGGTAYVMELEGTAVLVAGNAGSEELEGVIRSLERRKR